MYYQTQKQERVTCTSEHDRSDDVIDKKSFVILYIQITDQ